MIQFDYQSLELYKPNIYYRLSSVFGEDNFFYGLFEKETDRLVRAKFQTDLPKDYCFDPNFIEALIHSEKIDDQSITETKHAVATADFNLIPEELVLKNTQKYLRKISAHPNDPEFSSLVQNLKNFDMRVHFNAPAALIETLSKHYDAPRIVHLNGALIGNSYDREESDYVIVNFFGSHIQTVVYKNNRLHQSNHYGLSGEFDALYYVLLNYKHHDLDPLSVPLYYTGPIREENQNINNFKQHLQIVVPLSNPDRARYSNVFLGKPKHLFYLLQSVLLCE